MTANDETVVLSLNRAATAVPPQAWFGVSAVFHYLGPAFAVLLFPAIGVLGVAWMRIASAAVIFAPWTKPWRTFATEDRQTRQLLLVFGAVFAVMNTSFYLALDRLPISLVAAIEFVGIIGVALYDMRSTRNLVALLIAVTGVFALIDVIWVNEPWGLFWAVLNGTLFVAYIALGHRLARIGAGNGVQRLGAAMVVAMLFVTPIGIIEATRAIGSIALVLAGIGVGLCSNVIPYICDQLAMSRLPRASFALLLALLPATATVIGIIVLAQVPSAKDVLGLLLVMVGIALHQPPLKRPATRNQIGSNR